jgi:hypothetical protein
MAVAAPAPPASSAGILDSGTYKGEPFLVSKFGVVPPGHVYGESSTIQYRGNTAWLWTNYPAPSELEQWLDVIAIPLAVGAVAAGAAAAAAPADAAGAGAAASGAATVAPDAAGGAAAGGGAGAAASKLGGVAKDALGGAAITAILLSTGLWKGIGLTIAGAILIFLAVRSAGGF